MRPAVGYKRVLRRVRRRVHDRIPYGATFFPPIDCCCGKSMFLVMVRSVLITDGTPVSLCLVSVL